MTGRSAWRKVVGPKTWHPKHNCEELVGFYGGQTEKRGRFGSYSCVIVNVPRRGAFMVSGVQVLNLVDASSIDAGDPIRIVYLGRKDLGEAEDGRRKEMKLFEVYEAGDAPEGDEP